MSRKDFLKLTGMGLLVLINLDILFKLFHHGSSSNGKIVDSGYGSSGYSGYIGKPGQRKGSQAFD
jgi:hypothetical protein